MIKKTTGLVALGFATIGLVLSCGAFAPEPNISDFTATSRSTTIGIGQSLSFQVAGSIATADTNDFADLSGTIAILVDEEEANSTDINGSFSELFTIKFDQIGKYEVKAVLTQNSGGKSVESKKIEVTVEDQSVEVTDVTVSPGAPDTIVVGDTLQLTATVTPANAANKKVTWSSDYTSIATVNSNGLVTAVSNGMAFVTAKTEDGDFKSTAIITVRQPNGNSFDEAISLTVNASSSTDQSLPRLSTSKKYFKFTHQGGTLNLAYVFGFDLDLKMMIYRDNQQEFLNSVGNLMRWQGSSYIENVPAGTYYMSLWLGSGLDRTDVQLKLWR